MKNPYGNKRLRTKAARELEVAIEVLDATGWCKGSLGEFDIDEVDGDGAHCALGAIASADSILGVTEGGLTDDKVYNPVLGTPYATAVQAVIDSIPKADRAKIDAKLGRATSFELAEPVFLWNDKYVEANQARGKAQIKRAFRRAIAKLEA